MIGRAGGDRGGAKLGRMMKGRLEGNARDRKREMEGKDEMMIE